VVLQNKREEIHRSSQLTEEMNSPAWLVVAFGLQWPQLPRVLDPARQELLLPLSDTYLPSGQKGKQHRQDFVFSAAVAERYTFSITH